MSSPASTLTSRLKSEAQRLGFGLVGVTDPGPSAHLEHFQTWLRDGHQGEMSYLSRPDAVARRGDLSRTLQGVRSVVVVTHDYARPAPPGVQHHASRGIIARYARGRDYHKVVKKKLLALARWLEQEAPGGEHRAYVDTGPILERDLARRAGLGWFGRNTMLIHPKRGSYFFLGVLLTTVELDRDAPFESDRCGSCTACLDACPTGALLGRDEVGAPVLDARLCISYLTIEHRGEIPVDLRRAMGNRVYGCDICQEVCPWNGKFLAHADEPAYEARGAGERPVGVDAPHGIGTGGRAPSPQSAAATGATPSGDPPAHPGTASPSLVDLLRMDPEAWDAFTLGSAMRRAGYEGFRRNVLVAIGNWLAEEDSPPTEAVQAVRAALEGPDAVARGHAEWVLSVAGLLPPW